MTYARDSFDVRCWRAQYPPSRRLVSMTDGAQRALYFVLARIENVAQPIADKVEAEDGKRNHQPRDDGNMGSELHISARLAEHQSPARRRRGKPKPRKLRDDSTRMAWAKSRLTRTKIG